MAVEWRKGQLAAIATLLVGMLLQPTCSAQAEDGYFGAAEIDITPALPIRLSGYAARTTEATGVEQHLYAKAAAFGSGDDTAIMIAVDCTGVPDNVADVVSASLSQQLGIARERVVITSTHTHSGPCVDGYAENIFGAPMPPAHQQRVEQYTAVLADKLEEVAIEALASRTPGHAISWGTGSVAFGANRRGGAIVPVDHDLPIMRVADPAGNTKAIITSYAAHAVTLNGGDNLVSGDWPGYAREAIETMYPGAMALVMIGAAGDINPSPLGSTAHAHNHGQSIANEVERLVSGNLLAPVSQQIGAQHGEVALQFATERVPGDRSNARLADEPGHHDYGITSWTFGDEIAMVFLEGEVTVDYSLRLKSIHDDGRMWVNAYSNAVQGYIPSERILYEGGYEADSSGFYYALPGRWAHGLEDKIVGEVTRQLDPFFNSADRLRLVVDRATGDLVILNAWQEPIALDAYTIESPDGNLGGDWNSLADQGLSTWDEADNTSPHRLTEFNPNGSSTLVTGNSLSLGTPLTLPIPARFGEEAADVELAFEYNVPGQGPVQGRVEFVNSARHNNLVLTIDQATGDAAIQNESPYYDAEIDGYTIASASGSLQTADGQWQSLADQGLSGWMEADNSSPLRITEFNPSAATLLDGGGLVLYLGNLLDAVGQGLSLEDLEFEFLLTSGETMRGVVAFGPLPGRPLPGDYDLNGVVDVVDYNTWKAAFGSTVPPGSGADGNADGTVDAADYTIWRDRIIDAAATSPKQVPEPTSLVLVAISIAILLGPRHPRKFSSYSETYYQ